MPLNFSDGSIVSAPPRAIIAYDTTGGCPPSRGDSNLIVSTFSITRSSTVYINAKTICTGSGRHDRGLYISGPAGSGYNNTRQAVRVDYIFGSWWDVAYIHWAGTFGTPGSYTVRFTSENGNASCGCGSGYGRMNIIVLEN